LVLVFISIVILLLVFDFAYGIGEEIKSSRNLATSTWVISTTASCLITLALAFGVVYIRKVVAQ
jgi:hypothetical protein